MSTFLSSPAPTRWVVSILHPETRRTGMRAHTEPAGPTVNQQPRLRVTAEVHSPPMPAGGQKNPADQSVQATKNTNCPDGHWRDANKRNAVRREAFTFRRHTHQDARRHFKPHQIKLPAPGQVWASGGVACRAAGCSTSNKRQLGTTPATPVSGCACCSASRVAGVALTDN